MRKYVLAGVAMVLVVAVNDSADALHASSTAKHPHLYAYAASTDQDENDPDIAELYKAAAKDKAKKLVVVGGLHGYDPTGEPVGQTNKQKKACSFSLGDAKNKGPGTGMNFIYMNIAKYTTNGSDVTTAKQQEIAKTIESYLKNDNYVLLSWCFSRVWAINMGL
jgi:hypothetical protein